MAVVRYRVPKPGLSDVTMSSTKTIVRVQPKGLGGRDLLHWQTEPMTKELDDEIARVRDATNRCGTGTTASEWHNYG
jgi:hypothetical protein